MKMNNNSASDHQPKMKRKRKKQDSNSEQYNSNLIMSDEQPLNGFTESLMEPVSLAETSVNNKKKKVTRKSLQKKGMQKSQSIKRPCRNSRKSLENSVIIINDSESESSDEDNADHSVKIVECSSNTSKTPVQQSRLYRQQRKRLMYSLKQRKRLSMILNKSSDKNKADSSVIIVACSPNARTPLQQSYLLRNSKGKQEQQRKQLNISKQRKRSSVILLDSDSSSSDIQNSSLREKDTNGENIAPSQTKDDIVELWSCLDRPSNINKEMPKECQVNQTKENIYTIDKIPDWRNLEYLRITNPKSKKRKEQQCFQTKYNKYKKSKKEEGPRKEGKLREIIVDGCNVAMAHTNGKFFSEKGIKLVIDHFESRGHAVKVFLPQHVRRKNLQLLEEMYKKGIVVFTPSRNIGGKWITSYDDRYILEYATKCGGIVISADQYRDLYREKPEWRDTIINRLLTPTFVGDCIMFPDDPLGRSGPDLDTFLRF